MDSIGIGTIFAWGLGLLLLIGFLHIWSLISQIRASSKFNDDILRAILYKLSNGDWTGLDGELTMLPAKDGSAGSVAVFGKNIRCVVKGDAWVGNRVRVIGKEGDRLVVERV